MATSLAMDADDLVAAPSREEEASRRFIVGGRFAMALRGGATWPFRGSSESPSVRPTSPRLRPMLNSMRRSAGRSALRLQCPVHGDGGPHGLHRAGKFRQHAVSGCAE